MLFKIILLQTEQSYQPELFFFWLDRTTSFSEHFLNNHQLKKLNWNTSYEKS